MDLILLNVNLDVDGYSMSGKLYNVCRTQTIRRFKTQIIDDLRQTGFEISANELANVGFCRVNSQLRPVYFLSDHTQAGVLTESCGITIANSVLKYQEKFLSAITTGKIRMINKYLSKGLDPNFISQQTNDTALMRLCLTIPEHQENILNILIENGLHLDLRNLNGESALHTAISLGNISAVKLLCSKGLSLHEWDLKGIPALFYALNKDVPANFLESILEYSQSLAIFDISQNNALHFCIKNALVNHFSILLKYMSKSISKQDFMSLISAQNLSGNTPLHFCVLQKQKACLELMAKLKACLQLKNSSGETALYLASRLGEVDTVEILKYALNPSCGENFSSYNCNRGSKYMTYSQSLQHCRTNANTLRKTKNSQKIFNIYPPVFPVIKAYEAKSNEELSLRVGNNVFVYMALKTGVIFGSRFLENEDEYGWFPSSAVNMNSENKIKYFQNEVATFQKLCQHIPDIATRSECEYTPIMLFVNLEQHENKLGLEIGLRHASSLLSRGPEPLSQIASPYYAREIMPNLPADKAGFRVGDQILYIMANDVSKFSLKTVTSIIKKMSHSKIPLNMPKTTIRQISFFILRCKEDIATFDTNFESAELYSDLPSMADSSTLDTFGSVSVDLNPHFYSGSTPLVLDRQKFCSIKRPPYNRPLPAIPEKQIQPKLPPKLPPISHSNTSSFSSFDSLPPPAPELL
ncbi:hypothetical protein HZS_1606, partial [Henneguya salminicola]